MITRLGFLLFFFSFSIWAADWQSETSTDAITDKQTTQAFVISTTGDRFTLLRRRDNSVWSYLELAPPNQFSVDDELIARVDKNEPVTFNEDLEQLSKTLGAPMEMWEWNPRLIGFRIWHGKRDEGCGMIGQLFSGSQLIIRYHPNKSTKRDVKFLLTGNRGAISNAIGFDIGEC